MRRCGTQRLLNSAPISSSPRGPRCPGGRRRSNSTLLSSRRSSENMSGPCPRRLTTRPAGDRCACRRPARIVKKRHRRCRRGSRITVSERLTLKECEPAEVPRALAERPGRVKRRDFRAGNDRSQSAADIAGYPSAATNFPNRPVDETWRQRLPGAGRITGAQRREGESTQCDHTSPPEADSGESLSPPKSLQSASLVVCFTLGGTNESDAFRVRARRSDAQRHREDLQCSHGPKGAISCVVKRETDH